MVVHGIYIARNILQYNMNYRLRSRYKTAPQLVDLRFGIETGT
jgi:hypothetical protein